MPTGYHLVFRLRDGRVIAENVPARRRIARSFLEIGDRYGLLAFALGGEHAHGEFVCDRAGAGAAAQAIGSSITQALGLPEGFNVTHLNPIVDQAHLENTFHYILGQDQHHGLHDDPLREGSAVPDLLGLRLLGTGMEERVVAHLPRASRESVRTHLPVAPTVTVFAPEHLADAAAAVFALSDLRGRSSAHVFARAAAVQVGAPNLRTDILAGLLGCSVPTVNRLRTLDLPSAIGLAVTRGMSLRSALGERLKPRLPAGSPPRPFKARA